MGICIDVRGELASLDVDVAHGGRSAVRFASAGHHLHNNILHTLNVVLLFLLLGNRPAVDEERLDSGVIRGAPAQRRVGCVDCGAQIASLTFVLLLALAGMASMFRTYNRTLPRCSVVFAFDSWQTDGDYFSVFVAIARLLALNRLVWPSSGNNSAFRKIWLALVMEKIPLLVMSAPARDTVYAQRRGGAVECCCLPLGQRFRNAIYSYVNTWKTYLAFRLAAFYPHRRFARVWKVVGAAAVLLLISAMVWRHRQRHYLVVGGSGISEQ